LNNNKIITIIKYKYLKTRQKYEILSHNWDETLQEKEKFFGNEQGSLLRMSNIALGSSKALSNNRKGSIMNINIFRSNQNNPQKVKIIIKK